MTTTKNIRGWVLAARPKTLTAAISPILVATAMASSLNHSVIWWVSILALLASLFIQIGTNFVNDAVDFKKGADTEARIGPQRVTQSGVFSGAQVMKMAALMFGAAVICGIPLVLLGGTPILIVGIISVLMGYAYTAGPFPLAYRGLGDVFVILFFGLVAVGGVYFLHTGEFSTAVVVAGLQVGFHCTVLIGINNLRDVVGDAQVGKKTLPVRLGKTFARWEIALLCAAPFLMGLYWAYIGFLWAFLLPWLALPLAAFITKFIFETDPSPAYNRCLGKAAALHLLFGILLTVGFCI